MIIDELMAHINQAKVEEHAQILSEDAKETFRVRDLGSATWAMSRYAEYQAKKAQVQAIANEEIKKHQDLVNDWLKSELTKIDGSLDYFNFLLTDYYMEQKSVNPKFKLSTPYGSFVSKTLNKWTYDEQILMPYLKANAPDCIRIKEELDKTAIKAKYANGIDAETGEVIEGITITEETTYSIKPAKEVK
jgi:hypothetical protein